MESNEFSTAQSCVRKCYGWPRVIDIVASRSPQRIYGFRIVIARLMAFDDRKWNVAFEKLPSLV